MTRLTLAALLLPSTALAHESAIPHDHGVEGLVMAGVVGLAILGLLILVRRR